jgi:hypothetical protein
MPPNVTEVGCPIVATQSAEVARSTAIASQ